MSVTSFSERQLRVTLILAGTNTKFPGTNSDTLILTNMRIGAKVQSVARLATQAEIRIYGMSQADMNALTVAWANPPVVLDHKVILEANDGNGWSQVFKGTITEAQPEYRGAPDVYFGLLASTGYFQKIDPAPPTSYQGAVPISTVAQTLATQMGFSFVNGGAKGVLNNPYFSGTLYDQLGLACRSANADFYLQGGTILITEANLPRESVPAVILNKDSGLIGYPVYDRAGLDVLAIFDPAFLCGTPIQLESVVPSATGRWYPYSLSHDLESRTPRGNWLTHVCNAIGC
jgi:hypothetical protein